MTDKTKELFTDIQNLAESLRQKLMASEVEKSEWSRKNEELLSQLSVKEALIVELKKEVSELKSTLIKTETNLVEKSNGGRDNQAIDELVKEIDNYIEKLKK